MTENQAVPRHTEGREVGADNEDTCRYSKGDWAVRENAHNDSNPLQIMHAP
jgi:hypothetical protein